MNVGSCSTKWSNRERIFIRMKLNSLRLLHNSTKQKRTYWNWMTSIMFLRIAKLFITSRAKLEMDSCCQAPWCRERRIWTMYILPRWWYWFPTIYCLAWNYSPVLRSCMQSVGMGLSHGLHWNSFCRVNCMIMLLKQEAIMHSVKDPHPGISNNMVFSPIIGIKINFPVFMEHQQKFTHLI